MPRVSIAVPAYNCEKYIAQSLTSLLAQTYTDFELVISDNASTDRTEQICREFAERDARVRYVRRTENIGGPGNFRYVFSLCSGEYHKWSTADDYWDPTFLARSVRVLDERHDVVLCYPKTQLIDMEGNFLSAYEDNLHLTSDSPVERFLGLFSLLGLCNAHLGLIRRDAMAKTRLIGAEFNSDTHFLAELALYGKFWLLPDRLFFRRMHPASSSWDRSSADHQREYYDPGKTMPAAMHTWRKYFYLSRGVWRAPIPFADALQLTVTLARWARHERTELWRELSTRAKSRRSSP
jgi:glycosyltransferase involved in cell wall biosynthesis